MRDMTLVQDQTDHRSDPGRPAGVAAAYGERRWLGAEGAVRRPSPNRPDFSGLQPVEFTRGPLFVLAAGAAGRAGARRVSSEVGPEAPAAIGVAERSAGQRRDELLDGLGLDDPAARQAVRPGAAGCRRGVWPRSTIQAASPC